MKKFSLLIILCVSLQLAGNAQTFIVPENVVLKEKGDYKKYEQDVIDAAKWLENTPADRQPKNRKDVSSFLLQWIMGCPLYDISIGENLSKIYGKNAQLLLIYMAGYSRNMGETQNYTDTLSATRAGLISMMKVYEKDIDITKSKEMEKLIKMRDDGKLDDYIKDHKF